MTDPDWKQRFIAQHQFGHLDPIIVEFLLDHSDPVTADAIQAAAKQIIINVRCRLETDKGSSAISGWGMRIRAATPPSCDQGDLVFLDDEDDAALVPTDVQAAFELDIERAAAELRPLRDLIKKDHGMKATRSRDSVVVTSREPRSADWAVWLAKPSWTAPETAALLMEMDPREVNQSARRLPGRVRVGFAAKLDYVVRHAGAGSLKDPATPDKIREWALKYATDEPIALIGRPEAIRGKSGDDPEYIHHHKKAVYQISLLYLALKNYGYDAYAASTAANVKQDVNGGVGAASIAAKMEDDLDKVGLKISAKKLSEYLREAAADLIGSGGKGVNVERLKAATKLAKKS